MDNIFKSIRTLLGYQAEVSESAIDVLDGVNLESDIIEEKIEKAIQDFDHANDSLSLKISACNMLIEKGNSVGVDNKGYLVDKLNRITTQYHEEVSKLVEEKREIENRQVELESDIITKSVQIVSALSEDNQLAIKNILDVWNETGLIKGEEVQDQLRAITLAIDEIVKGGQGSGRHKAIHNEGDEVEHEGKSYIAGKHDSDVNLRTLKTKEGKIAQDERGDNLQVNETRLKKKSKPKHSTEQIVAHAENTSSKTLNKVSKKKDHPHSDAAERELERRASQKAEFDLKAKSKQLKKGEDGEELEAIVEQKIEELPQR